MSCEAGYMVLCIFKGNNHLLNEFGDTHVKICVFLYRTWSARFVNLLSEESIHVMIPVWWQSWVMGQQKGISRFPPLYLQMVSCWRQSGFWNSSTIRMLRALQQNLKSFFSKHAGVRWPLNWWYKYCICFLWGKDGQIRKPNVYICLVLRFEYIWKLVRF